MREDLLLHPGHESLGRSRGRMPDRRARQGPPTGSLGKTQARGDTRLFLAAPQTLGRPIKLHQIDAFHAGAVQQNSGSNKRDQRYDISILIG